MKEIGQEDLVKLEGLVAKTINGEMQEENYKELLNIFNNPRLELCKAFAEALVPPNQGELNVSEEALHKLVSGLMKESAIRAQDNTFFRAADTNIVKELLIAELSYHISTNKADKIEQTSNILKEHLREIVRLENNNALAKTDASYQKFISFNILNRFEGEEQQEFKAHTEKITIKNLQDNPIDLALGKTRISNKSAEEIVKIYKENETAKIEALYIDQPYLRPKTTTITEAPSRLGIFANFIKDNPVINYIKENPWKAAGIAVGALALAAATVVTGGLALIAAGVIGGAGYVGYKSVIEPRMKSRQEIGRGSSSTGDTVPTAGKEQNIAHEVMKETRPFSDKDKKIHTSKQALPSRSEWLQGMINNHSKAESHSEQVTNKEKSQPRSRGGTS